MGWCEPDQLMRNADLALYRAKGDGRGSYCFFEPDMDAQLQERSAMECDMRKALVAGQFELYYQPIVSFDRDEIRGVEALIRWHHPEKGMLAPGQFIPLAEEIGFIMPLGEWVLRDACATAAQWPDPFEFKLTVHAPTGALAVLVIVALVDRPDICSMDDFVKRFAQREIVAAILLRQNSDTRLFIDGADGLSVIVVIVPVIVERAHQNGNAQKLLRELDLGQVIEDKLKRSGLCIFILVLSAPSPAMPMLVRTMPKMSNASRRTSSGLTTCGFPSGCE